MNDPAPDRSVPAFEDFLAYLRRQGFTAGVGHYVRVEGVLRRAGSLDNPRELKTLLCPIFATSEEEQERFYNVFDAYVDGLARHKAAAPDEVSDEEGAAAKERERVEEEEERRQEGGARQRERARRAARKKWLLVAAGAASLALIIFLLVLPNWPAPEDDGKGGSPSPEPTQTATPDIIAEPEQTSPPPIVYLLVAAALLGAFLLVEVWRRRRSEQALSRQPARRAPTLWPLRVDAPLPKLYDSEEFYKAARLMRRRQFSEFQRLDIDKTIAATVAALGFPNFRYRSDSKAPEYLVLIDRASFRDHQSHLFNELVRAFEQEGLFVVRYFYADDPRVCCDEQGENCTHLSELQGQFHGHRLLIFGSGDQMIDPVTGRLASWTGVFSDWHERAVLTPETRWGLREQSLASQFVVLPASLDGLVTLVSHFEMVAAAEFQDLSRGGGAPPPDVSRGGAVEPLREYLGEKTFRWLCACAIYPELQWDLTLYLGSLPQIGEGVVDEENLLRLIRLPWFRSGAIPDDFRWPLINALDEGTQAVVRAALINFLERNPPPRGTFAADRHDLELALQHWLREGDAESLAELRHVSERLPPGEVLQDRTLVRYLERAPNPVLDVLLPRSLRPVFFRNGLPWFGLSRAGHFLIVVFAIAVLSLGIRTGAIPVPINPTPTPTPASTPTATATVTRTPSSPELPVPPVIQRDPSTPTPTPLPPPLTAPKPLSPAYDSFIDSTSVRLVWSSVSGASSYNVNITCVDQYSIKRCGRRTVSARGITGTSYVFKLGPKIDKGYDPGGKDSPITPASFSVASLTPAGSALAFNGDPERYRWRVSAVDASGREGPPSAAWLFNGR